MFLPLGNLYDFPSPHLVTFSSPHLSITHWCLLNLPCSLSEFPSHTKVGSEEVPAPPGEWIGTVSKGRKCWRELGSLPKRRAFWNPWNTTDYSDTYIKRIAKSVSVVSGKMLIEELSRWWNACPVAGRDLSSAHEWLVAELGFELAVGPSRLIPPPLFPTRLYSSHPVACL